MESGNECKTGEANRRYKEVYINDVTFAVYQLVG